MTRNVPTSVALATTPASTLRPAGGSTLSPAPGTELSGDDLAAIRRQLRIQLLRDLVSNGLYRVPSEALAERLVSVVQRPA